MVIESCAGSGVQSACYLQQRLRVMMAMNVARNHHDGGSGSERQVVKSSS